MSSPDSETIPDDPKALLELAMRDFEDSISQKEQAANIAKKSLIEFNISFDKGWEKMPKSFSEVKTPTSTFLDSYYNLTSSVRILRDAMLESEISLKDFGNFKSKIGNVKSFVNDAHFNDRFHVLELRYQELEHNMHMNNLRATAIKDNLDLMASILQTAQSEAYSRRMNWLTIVTVIIALGAVGISLVALLSQAGILHL